MKNTISKRDRYRIYKFAYNLLTEKADSGRGNELSIGICFNLSKSQQALKVKGSGATDHGVPCDAYEEETRVKAYPELQLFKPNVSEYGAIVGRNDFWWSNYNLDDVDPIEVRMIAVLLMAEMCKP